MKSPLIAAALLLTMGGYANDSKALNPNIQKLQWLNTADPISDAQLAVNSGDLRLLGMVTRSISFPGVESDNIPAYEEKCGIQLIDGISDVVGSDEHLRLMQMARNYTLRYNTVIKAHCKI